MEPVTRKLAEVLAAASYDDLPAAVIDEAKRAVLDWLGSAMAGSMSAISGKIAATWPKRTSGRPSTSSAERRTPS